jgi:hypothetical protein
LRLGARFRGFSDEQTIEGGVDAERRARDELRREQRVRVAMTSGHPELARADLAPAHLGLLEHKPSGEFYVVSRGEQYGEKFDTFAAFIVERDGDVTFLERPSSGPQSRAELEKRRSRTAS